MTPSEYKDISADLAASLKSTTTLVKDLITEIRENAGSLAVLKDRLGTLSESVRCLSVIVRDGNGKGSLVTRLAIAEHMLEDLEENMVELRLCVEKAIVGVQGDIKSANEFTRQIEQKDRDFRREKTITKLKVVASILPGAVALIITLINLLVR